MKVNLAESHGENQSRNGYEEKSNYSLDIANPHVLQELGTERIEQFRVY
jgi:hypothetical protein